MDNDLNDLTGAQWLYFTSTVWETRPIPRTACEKPTAR
jgi:hypothetical protein